MQKRSQIALEFMILFSFLLIVFISLFAVVASQRGQTLSNQVFSQEQLIAQSVASQFDRAIQAGNGYTASVPITGSIGALSYQLIITQNGAVIINASVGRQVVQAIAYSSAKHVLSDSAFLQSGKLYYQLPIANGTLSIQNSAGTICVDYACPTTTNQAANLTLSSQVVHAGLFNGQTSYVTAGTGVNVGTYMTLSAWVKFASVPASYNGIVSKTSGGAAATTTWWLGTDATGKLYCGVSSGTATVTVDQPWNPWSPSNAWHHVSCTWDGTNLKQYIDGVQNGPTSSSALTVQSTSQPVEIGREFGSSAEIMNGRIANVQIYNATLSSSQMLQLYRAGIAAGPLLPANTVAWWPLNGDAKDYSGNGNNGALKGAVLFPTTAELFAKVTNQTGYALANDLIGFTTTLGNFTATPATTNYTNSNGIAIAFLDQQLNNGQATVKATAYNGNTVLTANLVGWWPLNLGGSNTIYDMSGKGNAGQMKGYAGWSNPNYVGSFDGKSGYVAIPVPSLLQPSIETLSFWFYASKLVPNDRLFAIGSPSAATPSGIEAYIDSKLHLTFNALGAGCMSPTPLSNNTWYFAASTSNGLALNCSINGMTQNSVSKVSGSLAGSTMYIGTNSPLVTSNFFPGRLANFQFSNTILSANQILSLYNAGISGVPISATSSTSNVIGWWPLDGDALDYGGLGNNGTIYGNFNFVPSPVNTSINSNSTSILAASFNGVNSYIATPFTQNQLSSLTVTMWVKPANMLVMQSSSGYTVFNSFTSNNLQLWLNNGGGLWATPGSGDVQLGVGGTVYKGYGISNNSWNFLAIAISNGKASFYANGAPPFNITIASGPYSINGLALAQGSGSVGGFNGLMANVQIYNSTLYPWQIAQIYQQGPAGIPINNSARSLNLLAWYPLNGNVIDLGGYNRNGTASNVIYKAQSVRSPLSSIAPSSLGPYGMNFNGASSYVTVPDSSSLKPSQFSISTWLYPTSFSPAWARIITKDNYVAGSYQGWLVLYSSTTGKVYLAMYNTLGNEQDTQPVQLILNTWNHITFTFDGSKITEYLNGVSRGSSSLTGTFQTSSNPVILGGGDGNNPSGQFAGSMSNVQIYSTALSANQVTQLYNAQMPPAASAAIPLSWYP